MRGRTIRYGVLGSLSIQLNGSDVPLNAPTLRQLLALLLAKANRAVTTDDLMAALWGETVPPGARKAMQVYMHRLRTVLGDGERINHGPGGYSLATAEGELDSDHFERIVAEAHAHRRNGRLENAADSLQEALQLWRGPAFEGLAEHAAVIDEARRLDEERLRAGAEHAEIELELGRHSEVIPRLNQLTAEHPYREDLRSHLMLALYRAGRQTEALEVFHRTRSQLDAELGIEPGPLLQRLHSSILRSSPELDLRRTDQQATPAPRELPPAVAGFSGRETQLAALDRLIPLVGAATSPQVALITGSGGVGKTALALHWAHKVADNFPNGQLFVDLRGYATGVRTRPIDALSAFLRSLGVHPQHIPVDPPEAAALYRSRLSGRRMLVILDNAQSAEEVRTLLPGTPGCLAIVTSRDRLTGLVARDGAIRVPLDVLSPNEAQELIAGLLDRSVHATDTKAISDLAEACAYLPLAVRIAVAHLLDRPYETVSQQVLKLQEGSRLEMLEVDGDDAAAVRSTFALSYRAVSPEAQLLFRRLGLVPCPDHTPESAAALTGLSSEHARRLLERLANAHLVSPISNERYVIHDLLREFAQETCLKDDSAAECDRAAKRLYHRYFTKIQAASQLLYPGMVRLPSPSPSGDEATFEFADTKSALTWLDAEHPNIVAVVRNASLAGPRQMAWLLAAYLRTYFDLRRHTALWFASARAGLAAARADGDEQGQAAMFQMLGHAYGAIAKHDAAAKNLDRAVKLSDRCGWHEGVALALSGLGVLRGLQGRPDAALPMFSQALELYERLDMPGPRKRQMHNLATSHWQLGNLKQAMAFCEEAISSDAGWRDPYYAALSNLGIIHHLLGQYDSALPCLSQTIAGLRSLGNRPAEAFAHVYRSAALLDLGRLDEAQAAATTGIQLARNAGVAQALAAGLTELGRYLQLSGEETRAHEVLQEAIDIATHRKTHFELAGALLALSNVQLVNAREAALHSAQQALDVSVRGRFRLREGRALVAQAQVYLCRGDTSKAIELATGAVEIQRETGHVVGEAEALYVLSLVHPDRAFAAQFSNSASVIYKQTGALPPRDLLSRLKLGVSSNLDL